MYIHTSTYIYFGNVLAYVCVCVCGAYNVSTYAHIFILLGVATLPHKVPHTHRTHTHTHIHSCTQTYLFKTNNIQKSTRRKNCCFLFLSPSLGAVQGCRLQTEIELRSCWFPRPPQTPRRLQFQFVCHQNVPLTKAPTDESFARLVLFCCLCCFCVEMNRRTLGFLTFKVIPAPTSPTPPKRERPTKKTETFHTKCCQPTCALYTDFDISWQCSWAALTAVNVVAGLMLHCAGEGPQSWAELVGLGWALKCRHVV